MQTQKQSIQKSEGGNLVYILTVTFHRFRKTHLVSNNGFLLGLKLHYKHIEQLRCRRFSKLLLLLLGRIEKSNIELILPTLVYMPKTNKNWGVLLLLSPSQSVMSICHLINMSFFRANV